MWACMMPTQSATGLTTVPDYSGVAQSPSCYWLECVGHAWPTALGRGPAPSQLEVVATAKYILHSFSHL